MGATGYAGYVLSIGRAPWLAIIAVFLFIAGFVLPLIKEYRRLGAGFEEIEYTYRANRRRDINPPRQEVLMTDVPHQQTRRSAPPVRSVLLCALIAVLFLGFDIADLIINAPETIAPSDTISNF